MEDDMIVVVPTGEAFIPGVPAVRQVVDRKTGMAWVNMIPPPFRVEEAPPVEKESVGKSKRTE